MAAASTVSRLSSALNTRPLTPRRGVLTLTGYGISVRVDRGHLVVEDGVGATRHSARFARVGHGLRRLVVIGADGFVSLAALRWLADQGAAFVMLDRDGRVLLATGPIGPKDARLRRAQALAHHNGNAVPIARELIGRKLTQQARIADEYFGNHTIAGMITATRDGLTAAGTIRDLRH